MKKAILPFLVCAVSLLAIAQTKPAAVSGPPRGSLVIVGGGKIPASISDRFISLAGGRDANFVLVPTASEDEALAKMDPAKPDLFGLTNVTVLHTRDRKVADTEAFVAPLRKARGIWFSGGRQWRLVDSYLGTLFEREVKALLDRGGVVGGSSAGASIQASYLVRGAREGNQIMMARGYEEGFGLLTGAAVDQHINTRKRESDLAEVIHAHPDLLGIGLYESTAIIVKQDQFEIIGDGRVAITDGRDHSGTPYYMLSPGDRFNLRTRAKL